MLTETHNRAIFSALDAFLASSRNVASARLHIEDEFMRVYVRKSTRLLDGAKRTTLDIATVEVDEQHRGKGHFGRFLAYAEIVNPFEALYIESVLDPAQWAIYESRGFRRRVDFEGITQDFFKLMQHQQVAA
jgi:predicted acetyltransferase